MRKAVLLIALFAMAVVGGSGYALAGASWEDSGPRTVAPTPKPTPLSEPCDALDTIRQPRLAYADCDTQRSSVYDPRTGASYTAGASVSVCRREASGDECVGTTQTVGRTGAEARPTVAQEGEGVALPQACVGSTCTPSASVPVPRRVTVFDSGTAPEVSAYTAGGAVNANAPQACLSLDDSCGSASNTGTRSAGVENVNASQLVTTN